MYIKRFIPICVIGLLAIGCNGKDEYDIEPAMYRHPVLRFAVRVPPKWVIESHPSGVRLRNNRKCSVNIAMLGIKKSGDEVLRSLASKPGCSLISSEKATLGGQPATMGHLQQRSEDGLTRTKIWLVPTDGGQFGFGVDYPAVQEQFLAATIMRIKESFVFNAKPKDLYPFMGKKRSPRRTGPPGISELGRE